MTKMTVANLTEKGGAWIVTTTAGQVLGTFPYDGTAQRTVQKERAFLCMRTFNCAQMGKAVS